MDKSTDPARGTYLQEQNNLAQRHKKKILWKVFIHEVRPHKV